MLTSLRSFLGFISIATLAGTPVFSEAYEVSEQQLDGIYETVINIEEALIYTDKISYPAVVEFTINKWNTYEEGSKRYELLYYTLDEMLWSYTNDDYMHPEDCYEDETFDAEDGWCLSNSAESEFETYEGQTREGHSHDGDEVNMLATFSVQRNSITGSVQKLNNKQAAKAQEVWEIFAHIIPYSLRDDLVEYKIFDDENADYAAAIGQKDENPKHKIMEVNLSSMYVDDSFDWEDGLHTLIHEFIHIYTFDDSEVDLLPLDGSDTLYAQAEQSCVTVFVQEGCLKKTALLYPFITQLWSEEDLKRVWQEDKLAVYTPEKFVSEYAATNPGEDIAETLTAFILGQNSDHVKVQFFKNFDTAKKLRAVIQSRIRSYNK